MEEKMEDEEKRERLGRKKEKGKKTKTCVGEGKNKGRKEES